ncbi:MAG: spore coat associated protein CotJA [Clostridia bacterium]|nr:spore coat associated protein CotJA [Clostridia bacterium]
MAYVPFQTDKTVFEADVALKKGTLFTDLYKPFLRGALK